MAKLLVDIPDLYKYLLNYNLTLVEVEEKFDYEPPAIPQISLTFVRSDKNIEEERDT
jgi:hypothetical protein